MIIVAGEALIDLIASPDGRLAAMPGGGPYNTARTIGRLGGAVAFLGRVSRDRFGQRLRANLELDGVALDLLVATDDPTTLAVAELDGSGAASYRFYTLGTSAPGLADTSIQGALARAPRALHLGTLGLVLEPMATTLEALVGRVPDTTLVMVDVNARPTATPDSVAYRARVERILARADVIKVSTDDLRFLYPDLDLQAALSAIASPASGGSSAVLCTAGGDPIVVAVGPQRVTLAVPPVEVVDTVGAGDAFGAGFLHAWVRGGRTREDLRVIDAVTAAARFGSRVAALTVGRAGAEPPYAREMEVGA